MEKQALASISTDVAEDNTTVADYTESYSNRRVTACAGLSQASASLHGMSTQLVVARISSSSMTWTDRARHSFYHHANNRPCCNHANQLCMCDDSTTAALQFAQTTLG
jgi:hypothetical protein